MGRDSDVVSIQWSPLCAPFLSVLLSFKLSTCSKAEFTAHTPLRPQAALTTKTFHFPTGLTSAFGLHLSLSCSLQQPFRGRMITVCPLSLSYETPLSFVSYKILALSANSVWTPTVPLLSGIAGPLLWEQVHHCHHVLVSNHVLLVSLSCLFIALPLGLGLTCPEVDMSSKLGPS